MSDDVPQTQRPGARRVPQAQSAQPSAAPAGRPQANLARLSPASALGAPPPALPNETLNDFDYQVMDLPFVNVVAHGGNAGQRDTLYILGDFEGMGFTLAINLATETRDEILATILRLKQSLEALKRNITLDNMRWAIEQEAVEMDMMNRAPQSVAAPAPAPAPNPAPLAARVQFLPPESFPAAAPQFSPAPDNPNRKNLLRLSRRQRMAMGLEHSVPGEGDGEGF